MCDTEKPVLAIFDFDGTIIRGDSFGMLIRASHTLPGILLAALKASPKILAWKLRLIPGWHAKQALFSALYRGMTLSRFTDIARSLIPELDARVRPEIFEAIRMHQEQGHRVVILTASSPLWITPWAAAHNITEVIGTLLETAPAGSSDPSAVLTGRFATPNCIADEKVRRLRARIPYLDSYTIFSYADQPSDAPVQALSRHPVWVSR